MEAASQLIDLGKYGAVGIILALIGLSGGNIYILWKIVTNHNHQVERHVENNNELMRENHVVMRETNAVIREHTKASTTLIQTIVGLEKTIDHLLNHK